MAYSVSAAAATSSATPKINQPVLITVTVTNAGTIDIKVTGVHLCLVGSSSNLGSLGKVVAVDEQMAGSGATTPAGTACAASGTAAFTAKFVGYSANACSIAGVVYGTRNDTGATVSMPITAVTVTPAAL